MNLLADYDFNNKRALIRVDFNVPLKDGVVTDNTRIKAALPTIRKILEDGGSCVLVSHLGRPKGVEEVFSLSQIVSEIEELLGQFVKFVPSTIDQNALNASFNLKAGEVLLLENLRFDPREKSGDEGYARALSQHGDVYVNDAFGTAHRAHASTAVVARYFEDKMFGLLLENEILNIDKVLHGAERPLTAIVGGAKVSSKINILENLLSKTDHLIIGGGMAYTFIKAQGGNIGASLVEDDYLEKAKSIMAKADELGVKIHLPIDTLAADKFSADANTMDVQSDKIPESWMGLDIGPEAIKSCQEVIMASKTILWNGPMGVFEMEAFAKGTIEVAMTVAKATSQGAYSLIGGGDSVAAINKFGLDDEVSYISTGGGAMLEYLEGKTLPGIAAIKEG
ncbi:MAG: phosphoglycerate kinase [Patiriisocius sp.]|jgi:phosphoglycerate kinase